MADEQDKQDIRDQANRIFQHGLYEDSALTERSNYFLIAESMLVVAYTGLISSASAAAQQTSTIWVARILAFFGLLLTIVWMYVNRRQWYVIQHLQERLLELVPEYKETYETRRKWRISSIWLMVYLVPALISVMWAIFIFIP
jgi:hypothetical protein